LFRLLLLLLIDNQCFSSIHYNTPNAGSIIILMLYYELMISDGEKLKQKQFEATGEKHEREHVHVVLVVGEVRQKRPVGHRYRVDAHDRTATRLQIILKIVYGYCSSGGGGRHNDRYT